MDKHTTAGVWKRACKAPGLSYLLVTGAGGALGAILRDSGGAAAGGAGCQLTDLTPILIPFIVATLVRLIRDRDGGDDHCRLDFRAVWRRSPASICCLPLRPQR